MYRMFRVHWALAFLIGSSASAVPMVQGFIENVGQLPSEVRYYAPLGRGMLYVTARGYGYVLYRQHLHTTQRFAASRIELRTQSQQPARIEATDQHFATLNFYRGSVRYEGVRVFRRVVLGELFPGIDAVLTYHPSGRIKCDYIVSAGSDPSRIAFSVVAAEPSIGESHKLHLRTSLGTIVEAAPVSYQDGRTVRTRYVLDGTTLRFAFDDHITTDAPLTIDPEIEWSSFIGGSASDQVAHVRTDRDRSIVVLGRTQSLDFPTQTGYTATLRGDYDAFIAKYSASGTLLWATYYGGVRREIHNLDHCDLVIDPSGNVVITGCTQSDDLPVTPTAFQRSKASSMPSGYDLFLAEFSPNGQLVWSSYCGGHDNEDAFGIATDRTGNIYVAGHTSSDVLPITTPATPVVARKPTGSQDVFILKLSPQRQPLWVYFIGGANVETATDIVTDTRGGVYVCGYTQSVDFPTFGAGVYQSIKTAGNDGFVIKLDGLGQLQWATLLGGNGEDYCTSLALDSSFDRRLIVGGTTSSTDMWYRAAEGKTLGGSSDGFIAALDGRNGAGQWVAYHGGTNFDELTAVAIDPNNFIIAVGRTLGEYPTKAAPQPDYRGGGGDIFVAKLTPDGKVQWATYVGGSFRDRASDVAIDGNTNFVVVGQSASADFPILGTAPQAQLGNPSGIDDGVLVKFCNIVIPTAIVSGTPEFCRGESRILTATGSSSVQYDSYQWELGGVPISGATEPTYTIPATLDSGTYRYVCRVTNTARCPAVTDTIVVRINPLPAIGSRQFVICYGDPIRLDSIPITGIEPLRYRWSGEPPPDDPTSRAPLVHPATTTTYTVHVTDANGCTAERSFTVLVLPISRLPIAIEGQRSFCEGDSAILSVPNDIGSIRWNTGETTPTITVRTSGQYFAVLSLPSGCEGYTDTVTITVKARPKPSLIFDGSKLATTERFDRYQWMLDDSLIAGETAPTLEPQRSGKYRVLVEADGCSGISDPLAVELSAQVHLEVASATVAIGETVHIPIQMSTSRRLDQLGIGQGRIEITYNASVLHLLPSSSDSIRIVALPPDADHTAHATITTTALANDTIVVLEFVALWGNADSSDVAITRVFWDIPTVTTTWRNGTVWLTGFCKAGTTRLYDDTGQFGIRTIAPQPSHDAAAIEFVAIEDSPHTIEIIDVAGKVLHRIPLILRAGRYITALDVSMLPQGRYQVVLRSATMIATSPLVIVR